MTDRRPKLRDLLGQHPPRDWGDLTRGRVHMVPWLPPMKIGDLFKAKPTPEKTTVYRALFKAEYVGGRQYTVLGRWEDEGGWQSVGTIG